MQKYFCSLLLFFSLPGLCQTFYQDLEATAMENNLVGMSVVVVCDREVSDVYHYGLADISNNLSVNDDTHYRIASISKAVTATGLMKQYEWGLFGLDDDISDYLGYEVVNPNHPEVPITFRMLLSHTSGLQDGDGYFNFLSATYSGGDIPNIEELLVPGGDHYTSDMWRPEMPGTFFQYSNINFGLIATLIEKLNVERFDVFMRTQLLEPMGIKGSFNVQDLEDINDVAVLYRNGIPQADNYNGTYPNPPDLTDYEPGENGVLFSPQGGLRVSALELARFMLMHLNHGLLDGVQIMDSTTLALMREVQWSYDGSNGNNYYNLFNQWGLGIQSTTNAPLGDIVIDGVTMYGHAGEAYGLISDLYFDMDKGFGVIFMTNGYFGAAGYDWGDYSAFYIPEEGVFSAVEAYHYEACELSTSISSFSDRTITIHFSQATNLLQILHTTPESNVLIFDLNGRVVHEEAGMTERQLDLPAGMYFVKVEEKEGEVLVKKIVVGR